MNHRYNHIFLILIGFLLALGASAQDSTLHFPFSDKGSYPFSFSEQSSPLYLKNPSNINSRVVYDPLTGKYVFTETIGSWNYRNPSQMTMEQYAAYDLKQQVNDYWRLKASGSSLDQQLSFIPPIQVGGEAFDKLFGSNVINIVPSGSAELIFGFNLSKQDNPNINERLRSVPSFTFDEKIIMNVAGSIGDKMAMDISYNTEATFDFENQTKLEYSGKEDEIIKKIEGGNVNLPLPGSLISGSQSLFGLKTELQFGKMTVTSVFSQQRGESSVINVQGGSQLSEYSVTVDDYDANKHFFLSEYFRENYNQALSRLPIITSDVSITRIEVWVTNKTTNFEQSRNIVVVNDLAEPYPRYYDRDPGQTGSYPRNELNNAYVELTTTHSAIRDIKNVTSELEGAGLVLGTDFEKIENARLLSPREYTFNDKLGYISLNTALNTDEILAVAYEYTYRGQTFRVGELSESSGISAPSSLMMKLLKPTNFTPRSYTWDLMMKNVYALGAYQVNEDEFTLDVLYRDDKTGNAVNYLPGGDLDKTILIRLLNLDNMNSQRDPYPDGVFDFISGITISPSNGRVFFPLLEPFGSDLTKILTDSLDAEAAGEAIEKFVFQELYDSTKTKAQQIAEKNKFLIAGEYSSSSSSEIMLNAMNVPQGSVKVSAGGRELMEGADYTVDYMLGRVTIINQGILESGTPIRISLENQSLFNFQTKTLVGTHLDYRVTDKFNLGATAIHLTERPLTQKVNIGDEPISNTIWGLNGNYSTESQFLTTLVDKLPFLETKAPSTITIVGEFAQLIPGHSRAIEKEGNAYIDDFEGSETSIDLKQFSSWKLSSTPRGFFPEAELNNNRAYGYNRARLAWYHIDPLFVNPDSRTPDYIKANPDYMSSAYVYEVYEQDIFPNKEYQNGIPTRVSVLNLAYYPGERGPYNYDFERIGPEGNLLEPEERWGGIMREIYSSDFEKANVEFIEFWLMDPFAEMPNHSGGELFFNLGNISEDVLKDSRKVFENGLPTSEVVEKVDTTVWGRVPLTQSMVPGFSAGDETRKYQDVGLDGLSSKYSDDEVALFSKEPDDFLNQIEARFNSGLLSAEARDALFQDPSSDDYMYYRSSLHDAARLDIQSRYKKYNNHEGNSPSDLDNQESYPTSGTSLPDIEDINRDNTLSEGESYYAYRVDINRNELEVGRNHIVDKVVDKVNYENGEKADVTWYQFRIPIYDYDQIEGDISDFKTIRFMRMFMTGFEDTTFLRFAKLDLVRGEWRRYKLPLAQGGEDWTGVEPPQGALAISAVNIEENAGKEPVNYVLPPGFTRQIDPMQPQLRQLNEQSIVLKVNELADGDARAAYKNTELDIRQYRKIRMEAHAEAFPGDVLEHNELVAFIRLGTDYKNNYYEYEVPLELTPPGRYDNDSESDRLMVWPAVNKFEVALDLFTEVKQARNRAMSDPESEVTISSVYSEIDEKGNRISVAGNPNMSSIRTIMIGIRNPKAGNNPYGPDDGLPKSGEIWLNELRLTDFNESGGWAANGRATLKLADFGNVTIAGNTSQPGFGSIEQKVQERQREQVIQYDVSSNLQMGKFFKQESGVNIPVFASYSKAIVNPEYNPLDPDIPLKEAIEEAETKAERDSIIRNARDLVERKAFAVTNVRMNKSGTKKHFYSLSNWSTSFSMNEMISRNPNLNYYNTRKVRGNISYNFNERPRNVQPFKSVKWMNSEWLRLVKDFNFNYTPSRISFRTDMDRYYLEKEVRNINNPDFYVEPTFKKDFYWNRFFDLKFDITRNLRFDFSSTHNARIDEPEGRWNYDYEWDALRDTILGFGRATSYFHQFNASYTIPINKIPLLDWTSANARYGGTYGWDVGPIIPDDPVYGPINLGNTIKNSNTIQLNGQLNFVNLYNKIPFLKDINDKYRNARTRAREAETRVKTRIFTQENVYLREGRPRFVVHNLKTEVVSVEVFDENNQPVEVESEILSGTRIRITSARAVRDARITVTGTIEKGESPLIFMAESTLRILMSVRTLNLTYSRSGGTLLPGYNYGIDNFGFGTHMSGGTMEPGWAFITGWQERDYAYNSFGRGALTTDQNLNEPYAMNHTERFTARMTVEPFNGLKIDLTANRMYSSNFTEYYSANPDGSLPADSARGRVFSGNFSMSYISLGTAFEKIDDKVESSESFGLLKNEYRKTISQRLGNDYYERTGVLLPPDSSNTEYVSGYGPTSQEVLIPAFLAAYGGKSPGHITTNAIKSILEILPNWQVRFDGLGKIEALQKYVNSIVMNHSYRSTYSVGSFINNPFYVADTISGVPIMVDLQGNFMVEQNINTVSINENFSPLFDINLDWKNSLTTRVEYKRSRTVAMNMSNTQVNEVNSGEFIVGAGYRFNEVPLIINQKEFSSDLNIRFDLSMRNNRTVIRKLEDLSGSEITAGQTIFSLKASADYMLSDKFTIRAFYDQRLTTPYISNSYPNANYNVGFSMTFTL
ncbi:MAG: cell surface protein SprA [Bacteroidales bacterium]|nr:cell surface protein SprA [Bacteroidales bacterium]